MFGHPEPRAGSHKGGRGRDVEGLCSIPAGTAGVYDSFPFHIDFVPVQVHQVVTHGDTSALGAHYLGRCGDFHHRLPFHSERRDEGSNLGLGGLPLHDGLHGSHHLPFRQILPCDDFVKSVF